MLKILKVVTKANIKHHTGHLKAKGIQDDRVVEWGSGQVLGGLVLRAISKCL